jgi:hypothetical protein
MAKAAGFLGRIVGLAIGAYLLAYVFIGSVQAYALSNTSALGTAGIALAGVVTIVLLISAVVMVLREAGIHV